MWPQDKEYLKFFQSVKCHERKTDRAIFQVLWRLLTLTIDDGDMETKKSI